MTSASLAFRLARLCSVLPAVAVVCLLPGAASAQKIDKSKLEVAARRSGKAAKVLTDLTALPPGESIPKELIEKARAVAVFPDVDKVNLLIQKAMKGYGLVSRRVPDGWSAPAFYGLSAQDIGWTKVKSEEPDIIMLFMNDGVTKQFEKDSIEFSNKLLGAAGPVGDAIAEQKVRDADIIVYALSGGKLRGVEVEDESLIGSYIYSDNNINKAVYGIKSREVLSSAAPSAEATVPAAVTEFQVALTKLSNP